MPGQLKSPDEFKAGGDEAAKRAIPRLAPLCLEWIQIGCRSGRRSTGHEALAPGRAVDFLVYCGTSKRSRIVYTL